MSLLSESMIDAMVAISPEQAQNYLNRWKLVHEWETRELRDAPMDLKIRQLAVLMASRDLFAEDHQREMEVAVVRERWARIR